MGLCPKPRRSGWNESSLRFLAVLWASRFRDVEIIINLKLRKNHRRIAASLRQNKNPSHNPAGT